jgi:hypothetical protein
MSRNDRQKNQGVKVAIKLPGRRAAEIQDMYVICRVPGVEIAGITISGSINTMVQIHDLNVLIFTITNDFHDLT